ncbi:MAG: transporter ATP-binding protein, partial [Oscillospiraceae bacterium]|nr:transporter ATP-binding protein [Oscillospiraceae bacterium]
MAAYDEQDFTMSFDLRIWKRLRIFLQPYLGTVALIIGFNLICALVDIALPLFQRYAVNELIGHQTVKGLLPFALTYLLAIIVQSLAVIVFAQGSMRLEMGLGRDMKRALFVHLQELSIAYYNVTPVGYLLTRVMSDTDRISALLAWQLPDIQWSVVYVLGSLIAMLLLNWKLAIPVLLIVPVLAVLTGYFQNKILHWNRKVRKSNSKITGAFNEGIMGAKTSKTLVIEESNSTDFQKLTKEMRTSGIAAARLSAIYVPLVLFCSTMAVSVVLVRGGFMVLDDALALGTLSAFISYAVGIFEPIKTTASNIADFISLQASIERVTGLLDQEVTVRDRPEVIARYGDSFHPKRENWEPLIGDIEFRDVTFQYPDGNETVLTRFSLTIPAGTTVALVGETGAGKSTLIHLVSRFYEPTQGSILIDGRDYRERSQLWLHSNIGYVLQNPHLFSGTVMENIRYGRLNATDEEVIAAARSVSADSVVEKLPNGWQSTVGEGGDQLSTGEKQLISFARAVLADPRIFILDEATSSVDTQTEQLIQNAISYLLRNRTSFIIAHRLSTIRHADLILVVKNGLIVEQGQHSELLRNRGYYYELYSNQFAEEETGRLIQ